MQADTTPIGYGGLAVGTGAKVKDAGEAKASSFDKNSWWWSVKRKGGWHHDSRISARLRDL